MKKWSRTIHPNAVFHFTINSSQLVLCIIVQLMNIKKIHSLFPLLNLFTYLNCMFKKLQIHKHATQFIYY